MVGDTKYTIPLKDTASFVTQVEKQGLSDKLSPVGWDWNPIQQKAEPEQPVVEDRSKAYMQSVDEVNRKMAGSSIKPYESTPRASYDDESYREAKEKVRVYSVNPQMVSKEEAEVAVAEIRKQEALIDDQMPVTAFTTDRKEFVDFYEDKLVKSAEEVNPNDYRDYFNDLDNYGKKYILPNQYQAEFGAVQGLNNAVESFKKLEAQYADKDPKIREDVLSKAWTRVEEARNNLSTQRESSYAKVDQQIEDLKKARQEELSVGGSNWNKVLSFVPGGQYLMDVPDEEKVQAINDEINRLELSKELIDLKPKEALDKLGVEYSEDEGVSPEEKLERYYRSLEKAYYELRGNFEGDLGGAVKGAVGSFFGTDESKAFADLKMALQALAPLVMLRRLPMGDDNAGQVFYKSFLSSFNPQLQAELEAESTQSAMNRIEGALEMAGAEMNDRNMGKAMDKIASPYEHFSAKDWAQMMGPTTAMMAQLTMSAPAFSQLMKIGKIGKFLEAGKKTGTILGTERGMTALGNTVVGRGVVKAVYGGLEEGIKFQTAGTIFGADEELNFISGMVGGMAAYPLATLAENGAEKTLRKQLARMFGDKTEDAYRKVYEYGEKFKSGIKVAARGPAETFEEFGNEIGNIYRESSNWSEVKKKFEERFGDMSENLHFAVSTAVMGWGFGAATNVGAINMAKSKKYYDNLTEVEKQQFRSFMEEINGELEQTANEISDTVIEDEKQRPTTEGEQTVETRPEGEDMPVGEEAEQAVPEQTGQEAVQGDGGVIGTAERLAEASGVEVEDIGDVAEGQKKVSIGETDITLSEDADKITLEKIRTGEDARGTGSATSAMEALTAEADKIGKPIELTLDPEEGVDKERLRSFYQRFGFEGDGDQMVRKPNVAEAGTDQTQENEVTPEVQEQETGQAEPKVQQSKVEKNDAQPIKDATGAEVGSKAEARSVVEKIAEQIQQAFGKLFGTTVTISDAKSVDGAVGKATADGNIVLNEEKLNANTPVHEAGHLWNRWAKQNRPELYQEGLNKVRKSTYYYEVKNNLFYQEQTKDMTPEQAEELYLEEALAVAIGNSGESFVTEARKKNFLDWFKSLMDAIADFLGIEKMSIEEIREMTLGEFADRVAASILSGQEIDGFVSGEWNDQYMAEKRKKFDKTMEENVTFESIRERIKANPAKYSVQSNAETVSKAIDWIEQKQSPDHAYQALLKPETWSSLGEDLAMINVATFILADTYAAQFEYYVQTNEGFAKDNLERWESLKKIMDKTSTNLGRAVNAYNIWKTMTPMGMAYMINQKIREFNAGNKTPKDIEGLQELMDELAEVKEELNDAKQRIVEEVMKRKQVQDALEAILKQREADSKKGDQANESAGDQKGTSTKATRGKKRHKSYRRSEEIKQEKANREKLWEAFENAKSSSISATLIPGLNEERIEIIGKIAISYVKEGYYRTSEIVDEILDQLQKRMPEIDEKDVETIVKGAIASSGEAQVELEKSFKSLTKKGLKKLGAKIDEVAKKHYSERDPLKRSLAEKISEDAGLTKEEAQMVANAIESLVEKSTKAYLDKKYLKKEEKPTKARETVLDVFLNSVNQGVLDDPAYMALFVEKFGLIPELTNEQTERIIALTTNLQQMEGEFYVEALRDLVKYMDQLIPKAWHKTFMDTWMGLLYSSMLSGPGTHVVNIYSVLANVIPDAMGDLVNFHQHFKNWKKGKAENQGAMRYVPDFLFRWAAAMSGILSGKSARAFKRVWRNGSFDEKWVDDIAKNSRPFNLSELEREVVGKHRFGLGWLNPFNYAKFVNRALSGEDSYLRMSYTEAYLAEQYRQILSEKLGEKATIKRIQELLNYDALSEQQKSDARDQAQKEAQQYFENTGKQLSKDVIKQREQQLLRQMVNAEIGLSAEASEEMMDKVSDAAKYSVFTGERHGVVSFIGRKLNIALGSSRILRFGLMRDVPFVTIVANFVEYALDGLPIYGLVRAYGVSPTGLYGRYSGKPSAKIQNETGYRRQMGRAWLGTMAFFAFHFLTRLDDDDDEATVPILITGSGKHKGDEYAKNPTYEPYSIYVRYGGKEVILNYLNWPGLNMMFNAVGEMNDRTISERSIPKEERSAWATSFLRAVTTDQIGMILDMSFLQGALRGVEDAQAITEKIVKNENSPYVNMQDETDIADYVQKRMVEKYVPLVTDVFPWNTNAVKQVHKSWMQAGYTRRTMDEAVGYAWAAVWFKGNFRVDAFGEKIFSVPTENFIPWRHYVEGKSNDPRWELLRKVDYIPEKPQNRVQTIRDKDGVKMKRKFTANEEAYYNTRAGEEFSRLLNDYLQINPESFQDRKMDIQVMDENKKRTTQLRREIISLHEVARKRAREETKAYIANGRFDEEYDKMYERLKNQ